MKEIQELIKELRNVAARCDLDNDYDMNDCAEDIREIANYLEKAVMNCNQLKMRNALEIILGWYYENHDDVAAMDKAMENAKVALSEPPRNCDVGTAEEQGTRLLASFKKWREDAANNRMRLVDAILKWAQMPYKKEGEE